MARILFGLIAPTIVTMVVWFIGSPPALSLFWDTADATIVGHETYEAETGYGMHMFNAPLVKIENRAKTLRINLPGVSEMDDVKADWPIDKQVRVKINPPFSMAIAENDPRLNYIVPVTVLAVSLVIWGLTLASYFIVLNTLSWVFGAFGVIFTIVPVLIVVFRWQIGYPPPSAHFSWPSERVEIVSQEIISRRIGNGTIQHTPVVKVRLPDTLEPIPVDGYRGGFRKDAEQVLARLGEGTMMKVNISPVGVPFEAKWDIQQIITIILTCLLPIFLFIGMVFFRVAWPSRR